MVKENISDENLENVSGGSVVPYTVVSGDTLAGIAVKYNVSVEQLKRWNSLASDTIIPGQVLFIKY